MNIGQFDQLMTALADMAVMLNTYRQKLEKEGFTRQEALRLCIQLQADVMTGGKK